MSNKIILLDVSVMSFKSAFTAELAARYKKDTGFVLPSHYTYFSSILSCLKKINVEEGDIIILAIDDKSWRKNYYAPYKAQRKEAREKHAIDWDSHWRHVSEVNNRLNYATPFHVLQVPGCEADDIMSVACRVFKDREVVIASIDVDLHQLCFYPNVKIFNLNFKTPKGKGGWVKISQEEALGIIEKKVKKGDVSDNILVEPNEDENDVELRRTIINLLSLPDFVEKPITYVLQNLPNKTQIIWEELPFQNSLAKRFKEIYDPQFKIGFEYCVKLKEKRIIKKKKKEADKRQLKKENKT
jgi:5'-3' exonuclease